MKRKLTIICAVMLVLSVCFSVTLTATDGIMQNDVSYASVERHYNDADDMNTTTMKNPIDDYLGDAVETTASGGLLDSIGGLGGIGSGGFDTGIGVGDIFGDAGDVIGNVIGGIGGNSANTTNNANSGNNIVYIDPVPAGTDNYQSGSIINTPSPTQSQTPAVSPPASTAGETVNNNATKNPFAKPVNTINPGDSGDGVKWMQWIFIYTNYGLTGKNITGVYDADTVEVVKKLQKEKGLTEDGIVNDAVVDKIELLYYEYTLTLTTAPAVTPSIVTAPETLGQTSSQDGNNKSLGVIIAIIAAIWCIAIAVIIVLFVLKKKSANKKAEADKDLEFTYAAKKSENESSSGASMSLSDLFEEANNK